MKSYIEKKKTITFFKNAKTELNNREIMLREIAIMKKINHPNIISLKEVGSYIIFVVIIVVSSCSQNLR